MADLYDEQERIVEARFLDGCYTTAERATLLAAIDRRRKARAKRASAKLRQDLLKSLVEDERKRIIEFNSYGPEQRR